MNSNGMTRSVGYLDLLAARYSCRAFRPDAVRVELVREILAIAQRSASWSNVQPWHTTVLAGNEAVDFSERLIAAERAGNHVSDIHPPQRYENEYRERRRVSGFALYDSLGIVYDDIESRKMQMLENFRFFGAPVIAIITSEASLGPYGYVDTGGFISNFQLAANSLGLATIAQAAIAMHSDVVREFLGIPDTRHVVCAISFGYADEEHPANSFRTDRAPVDEVSDLRGF